MKRLLWQIAFVRACRRSRYVVGLLDAWRLARDAWENQQQRGECDPIETPAEAFRFDKREWMTR